MSTELKKDLTPFQLQAHLEPVHAWQGQGHCCQTHDSHTAVYCSPVVSLPISASLCSRLPLAAIFTCQAQTVALAGMSQCWLQWT